MLISTKGRYALRVMADLARNGGEEYVVLMDIAERQNISEKYLEGIVAALSRCGFLQTQRGRGGGYRLARCPEEYAVGDILRAAEGSIAPVSCVKSGESECPNADNCLTLPLWKELDRVMNDYLESVTLAASHRSAAGILTSASALLGSSSACGKLIPTRNMEACLHLFSAPDARKEAAWVADQVALLLGGTSHTLEDSRRRDATLATPCSPGEVAVLVRMKALIPPLKTALERRGVPCSAPETAPFWGDPSAALILELAGLRFQRPFAAPEGPGSLDVDVPQLAASLPEQLWQAGPSALASHLDAAKLLAPLFTESAACNALLRAFREQGKTWEGLLDWVCLRQDLDLVREQAEQVQIMTLHAAKGLEFRAVFLPALEEGILPFPGADALLHGDPGGAIDPDALAEERRLFYVGLTRAQDAVFVSHAAQRHLYGKALELPPSRFLSALPELFRHTRLVRHVQTKATQMKLF